MADGTLISPSILSADMVRLGEELDRISSADLIHVDVMDGHFVPNLSYGTAIVSACKRATKIPLDVHLMVDNPDDTLDWYLDAGADYVTVHFEAARHLHRCIMHIKQRGARAGVAINPGTPVELLRDILPDLDLVLVMSVNPGFGGQTFIPSTLDRLGRLRALCDELGCAPLVEVDGGVGASNAGGIAAAGASALVAGSAVFGSDDPARAIREIRAAADAVQAGEGA